MVNGKARLLRHDYRDGPATAYPPARPARFPLWKRKPPPMTKKAVQEKYEERKNRAVLPLTSMRDVLAAGCSAFNILQESASPTQAQTASQLGQWPAAKSSWFRSTPLTLTGVSCSSRLIAAHTPTRECTRILCGGKITLIGCPEAGQWDDTAKS